MHAKYACTVHEGLFVKSLSQCLSGVCYVYMKDFEKVKSSLFIIYVNNLIRSPIQKVDSSVDYILKDK